MPNKPRSGSGPYGNQHDRCVHGFTWTSSGTAERQPPEHYVSICGKCGTTAIWRDGAWVVAAESEGSWAIGQARRYGDALTEIAAVLGSGKCEENTCEGCKWEVGEAIRIIREAVGLR